VHGQLRGVGAESPVFRDSEKCAINLRKKINAEVPGRVRFEVRAGILLFYYLKGRFLACENDYSLPGNYECEYI
jgi:hypothetical protein